MQTGILSGQGNAGNAGGPANADAELQRIREALAKEIESGKAEVERDGARVIIRLAEQGSFRSGSADLQPAFNQLLDQVGKTIAQSNGRIYIEGHTDNVPVVFNERFKSNWDLSGAQQDLFLYYRVGAELANSDAWPNWYEGKEFRAARDASRADVK